MADNRCTQCGTALQPGTKFCPECGNTVTDNPTVPHQQAPQNQQPQYQQPQFQQPQYQQPQYQQPQYQQPQYQQPQYQQPQYQPPQYQQQPQYPQYPQYYVKPKIPGRGMGIASMVLGIVGAWISFCLMIAILSVVNYEEGLFLLTPIIIYSVLPILALSFGVNAKGKGYINGVSSSGIVLGTISLVFHFIAFFLSLI